VTDAPRFKCMHELGQSCNISYFVGDLRGFIRSSERAGHLLGVVSKQAVVLRLVTLF